MPLGDRPALPQQSSWGLEGGALPRTGQGPGVSPPLQVESTPLGGLCGAPEGLSRPVLGKVPGGPHLGKPRGGGGSGTGLQSGRARAWGLVQGPLMVGSGLLGAGLPPGTEVAVPAQRRRPRASRPFSGKLIYSRKAHWGPPGAWPELGAGHMALPSQSGAGGSWGDPGAGVCGDGARPLGAGGKRPCSGDPSGQGAGREVWDEPGPPGAGRGWRGLCGQQDLEGGMRWGLASGLQGADCSGLAGVF